MLKLHLTSGAKYEMLDPETAGEMSILVPEKDATELLRKDGQMFADDPKHIPLVEGNAPIFTGTLPMRMIAPSNFAMTEDEKADLAKVIADHEAAAAKAKASEKPMTPAAVAKAAKATIKRMEDAAADVQVGADAPA